jgi:hypothetical protein
MVEINVKLEENAQVSHFTHAVGKALEEYLIKVHKDTFDRIQMLESQIINYYRLHADEKFKDYFGIVEESPIQEAEIVEEVEEVKKEKPIMKVVKEEANDIVY